MTYVVQRKERFYVVVYDGLDALTGRETSDGIRWAPTAKKSRWLLASDKIVQTLPHPGTVILTKPSTSNRHEQSGSAE
jgi:hypothetical protein